MPPSQAKVAVASSKTYEASKTYAKKEPQKESRPSGAQAAGAVSAHAAAAASVLEGGAGGVVHAAAGAGQGAAAGAVSGAVSGLLTHTYTCI